MFAENSLWAQCSVKDYIHIAKKGFLFSPLLIRNQQMLALPNVQAVQKTFVKDYKAVFMPHFHGLNQTALFGSFAPGSPPVVWTPGVAEVVCLSALVTPGCSEPRTSSRPETVREHFFWLDPRAFSRLAVKICLNKIRDTQDPQRSGRRDALRRFTD